MAHPIGQFCFLKISLTALLRSELNTYKTTGYMRATRTILMLFKLVIYFCFRKVTKAAEGWILLEMLFLRKWCHRRNWKPGCNASLQQRPKLPFQICLENILSKCFLFENYSLTYKLYEKQVNQGNKCQDIYFLQFLCKWFGRKLVLYGCADILCSLEL